MYPAEPSTFSDRMTAAFARVADARYSIGILERCGMAPVDIEIGGIARDRMLAAISGGHGVPMADPAPAAADAPIERVA